MIKVQINSKKEHARTFGQITPSDFLLSKHHKRACAPLKEKTISSTRIPCWHEFWTRYASGTKNVLSKFDKYPLTVTLLTSIKEKDHQT